MPSPAWSGALAPALVVAIGGGSALDSAKQAAAVAGAAAGVEAYALGARALPSSGPPVVAVPTTAGTGAEVTRTCVVTTSAGRKVWLWGEELLPRLVVLDPLATVSMPAHVTTATGLDACVHAVEAASGRRTSSAVEQTAVRAIRLVLEHLGVAVGDGTDVAARQGMQEAALLAGVAIDAGGTGIAHAIGHALGTVAGAQGVHVPHGVAVAVALAAALPWNAAGAPDALGAVATAFGRPVDELADAYRELLVATGLPAAVARIGPLDVDADVLAAELLALENVPMHDNNCRRPDEPDRRHLARSTLRTWADLLTTSTSER